MQPALRPVLAFAMVFPTVMAWVYFMVMPGTEGEIGPLLQATYTASKIVQFVLPLAYVLLAERALPRPTLPPTRGLAAAAGFGVVVVLGMLILYFGFLRGTAVFAAAQTRLRQELEQFNLASPGGFAVYAVFITLAHSVLEEYYWRWFVFARLTRVVRPGTANALSSLAFGAYHLVLLAGFFPEWFWAFALPLGVATAAGGAAWAWLYERSGSIYAPWLSHAIVDAGLFIVGYDMYFGGG